MVQDAQEIEVKAFERHLTCIAQLRAVKIPSHQDQSCRGA